MGTAHHTLKKEFCAKDFNCEVHWSASQSIRNLVYQLDDYCDTRLGIGMYGFVYLAGIVVGCLTVARMGDVWGRKPIYLIGMILNFFLTLGLVFSYNKYLTLVLLCVLGITTTMRAYVGYAYNIEM
jgi:MFS family permease